ncbi:hypothetical protein B0H14DRAFT_2622082 [Mycena olivaceomarginata]|nr:hypothetical protein B0H14DRAFT_2622082 [Mycena olivaceomarginata]
MTETAALERYKKKHNVIKLTPRAELERKKAKPLTKVLETLDVEQSAFKTDGVWVELTLAKQDKKEGGASMLVSEASEVEQSWSVDQIDTSQAAQGRGRLQATFRVLEALEEQAGQIYWSAFDGDGIQAVQEGRWCRGHPRRRPYLNYNSGNVPGIAGNKVGNGGQPQDTIYPDGDL